MGALILVAPPAVEGDIRRESQALLCSGSGGELFYSKNNDLFYSKNDGKLFYSDNGDSEFFHSDNGG